jgi:hypothetical protein
MKLLSKHEKAIKSVIQFIKEGEFYLAGGTAVYYYLKHRKSLDFDFFTQKVFDFFQYEHQVRPYAILFKSKDTIHAEIENVKVSFFYYPYNLLKPLNRINDISIADLEDILCMKINAIINRGSRKDFTDVYFIMKELSISPEKCIELFQTKYGPCNPLVIHKAMTYFQDADKEPELTMLKSVKWENIKKFFVITFSKL